MVLIEFFHDGELLGGYSLSGTNYRDIVHTLCDLADDYNVPRSEIKMKERTVFDD